MCNDNLPEIYLAKMMLPFNDRVTALFDTVEGK